jgi:endonuclease/exonuclease/phosphatase family metal-dependent hydrolase
MVIYPRHLRFLAVGILTLAATSCLAPAEPTERETGAAKGYLLCFWNVENLFDDHLDNRPNKADQEYDRWFAHDPHALQLKLAHLSKAIVDLNDGMGPDIVAIAEVESERAADLLRQAMNERLSDPSLHYEHVLMKEPTGGRHIAPAIITRLPVRRDRTRLHGKLLRILEGRVVVNGHELVIMACHWSSRVSDKNGDGRGRYGDQIYGAVNAMYKSNPKMDVVICGDFNDPPDAPSVTRHLRATADRDAVLSSRGSLLLLNLMAGKDPARFGTHYYKQWYMFDQIVVSPGMLEDEGWSCDPDSVRTVNTLYRPNDRQRRPWRFGNEHDRFERGCSDHFPVTVQLRVEGT